MKYTYNLFFSKWTKLTCLKAILIIMQNEIWNISNSFFVLFNFLCHTVKKYQHNNLKGLLNDKNKFWDATKAPVAREGQAMGKYLIEQN